VGGAAKDLVVRVGPRSGSLVQVMLTWQRSSMTSESLESTRTLFAVSLMMPAASSSDTPLSGWPRDWHPDPGRAAPRLSQFVDPFAYPSAGRRFSARLVALTIVYETTAQWPAASP